MPFSELQHIATGSLESTQTRMSDSSTDLVLPFKPEERRGGDALTPNGTRLGNMDAGLNDFSSASGLSSHSASGNVVPWQNYPLGSTLQHDLQTDLLHDLQNELQNDLQHDYCSEFFSALTGVNLNALATVNNALPIDNNSSYSQMVRESNIVTAQVDANPEQRNATNVAEADPQTSWPSGQLCHSQSMDSKSSIPSLRPKVPDFSSCNGNNNNSNHEASFRNSIQTPGVILANTKMQNHDPGQSKLPPNITGMTNFPYFSSPTAVAKANLQNINVGDIPGSSLESLRSNETIPSASNNPVESILMALPSNSGSVTGFESQPVSMPGEVDINSWMGKPPMELPFAPKSGALCPENFTRVARLPDNTHRQNSNVVATTTVRKLETEKDAAPVVASSSLCSGNSAGEASHILKRKSREKEETEYHSEDVEDESGCVKKPASSRGGMGAKRSRAAEVHNLSERRRRDKINEKMRALQELIPNCNKVDKASMLDEAIEYLKSLQLQVQIMSMGTGLYMQPMMLPTGMQCILPKHLSHFTPMGVGMGIGMGMGYGMGVVDMSNGSSASPMMQFPMNGVPYAPVAGSHLQMLGLPGQGLPMSMPRLPYIPPSEGPSTKSVPVPDLPGTATPPEVPVPPSSSKDPKKNVNTQMMHKTSAECSQNKTPQARAPREGFEHSSIVQRNDRSQRVGSNRNISSSNGYGFGTRRASGHN